MLLKDKKPPKFKDSSLTLELEEKEFKKIKKSKDGKRLWLKLNNTKKSMKNGLPKGKPLLIKLKLLEKLH